MTDTIQNVNRRPLDDFQAKREQVAGVVREVADVAGALGATTIEARIRVELVKKLEEDRFHLVVVGEFNHGKTSFVNALLGTHVLPTGVTPTTATIHQIRWAETPSARVVMASGEEKPIEFDHVKGFAVGGGETSDSVDHLSVSYPAPLLQERIVLVDTPGVNDLSLQRADITYSYIPRADAVLFLLDAGQILKESERAFLQEKIIGQSRDKIVFVITKWDLLSADEQSEALAYAHVQLGKLLGTAPIVFPVSAHAALAGDAETSGISALVAHLTQFLAEQRGRILLDNALGEALAASTTLGKGVDAKRRALSMDEGELARRIAAIEGDLQGQGATIEQRRARVREEVAGVHAWVRRDVERFVDDATRLANEQIDGAEPGDLKAHYHAYLEKVVRSWADAETREIAGALESIAERTIALVQEDANAAAQRVGEQMGGAFPGMRVEVDSIALDFGVMATLTIGIAGIIGGAFLLGGVMLVAAPILAMMARERVSKEYKRIAREKTPALLREVAAKIGPKLDEMIDDFANKLDAWVVSAGEELHRELLEVLKAATVARREGADRSAAARGDTEAQGLRLAATRVRLEAMRAALWGNVATPADVAVAPAVVEAATLIEATPAVNAKGGAS